jgi:hypothetical protein
VFSFSLTSRNLLISSFTLQMTHWSLSNVLFSFQLLAFFFWLISSFNALRSDRIHCIISIFLYLLRLALCSRIWSVLEKVPWVAEKNVYCVEVGWNVLKTSTRSICSMVCFRSRISLLIFLFWWPIGDRQVLKSPTTTVLEFTYVFRSFRLCLMILGALMLVAYRLITVTSFRCISPFISM